MTTLHEPELLLGAEQPVEQGEHREPGSTGGSPPSITR